MKKRYIKLLSIMLMMLLVFFSCNTSFATISEKFSGANVTGEEYGKKVTEVLGIVLTVVRTIGISTALLMMMVLGCKYMLASAGERAEIKKHATTYVIGAIVLVASAGIADLLMKFTDSAFK